MKNSLSFLNCGFYYNLRQLWQEALNDKTPGASANDVLDRLERKYQAIADNAEKLPNTYKNN